jgi:hypothetical protein
MIAFDISLNGERLSLAGRDDLCVLTFFLDAGGACGNETHMEGLPLEGCDVSCAVNGASSKPSSTDEEGIDWVPSRRLVVGDCVTVKIIETDTASPPVARNGADDSELDTFQPEHAVAFEVRKNGIRRVVAGRNDLMVLSAVVSAVGTLGAASLGTEPQQRGENPTGHSIDLHVVGKERRLEPSASPRPEWIRWEQLVPGDELSFTVRDTSEVDAPLSRAPGVK